MNKEQLITVCSIIFSLTIPITSIKILAIIYILLFTTFNIRMSDTLFSLIKALSTGEKIHFKRNAKRQAGDKDPAYLQLFDVIDKMDDYDKDAILAKLKNKKFTSDYAEIRSYLRELLIEFIQEYNTEKSIPRKAIKQFRKAQALYEKGLFADAHELLKKSKELAETYQLQDALYYIYTQEIQLCSGSETTNRIEKLALKHHERKKTIENLGLINEAETVFNILHFLYMETPSSRDEEIIAQAGGLYKQLQQLPQSDIFYPQLLKQLSASLYHNLTQNYAEMYESYKTALQLYEANIQMKERYGSLYLNTLKNYLASSHYYRNYNEYQYLLNKLSESIRHLKGMFKIFPQLFLCYLKLDILITRGEADVAIHYMLENKKKELRASQSIFNISIQFKQLHQYAFLFFLNADYKNANQYLNIILNKFDLQMKGRSDLFFTAKLMKLMITFELGDFLLLNDLLLSIQQYFARHNKLYELEKILFSHFKTLEKNTAVKSNATADWNQLKNLLQKFDPYFLLEFIGFDIMAWVDSKIHNRPMKDIIKEKAQQYYPDIFKVEIIL